MQAVVPSRQWHAWPEGFGHISAELEKQASSGAARRPRRPRSAPVLSVDCSSCGDALATLSLRGELKVWAFSTGAAGADVRLLAAVKDWGGGAANFGCVRFSRDGRKLALCGGEASGLVGAVLHLREGKEWSGLSAAEGRGGVPRELRLQRLRSQRSSAADAAAAAARPASSAALMSRCRRALNCDMSWDADGRFLCVSTGDECVAFDTFASDAEIFPTATALQRLRRPRGGAGAAGEGEAGCAFDPSRQYLTASGHFPRKQVLLQLGSSRERMRFQSLRTVKTSFSSGAVLSPAPRAPADARGAKAALRERRRAADAQRREFLPYSRCDFCPSGRILLVPKCALRSGRRGGAAAATGIFPRGSTQPCALLPAPQGEEAGASPAMVRCCPRRILRQIGEKSKIGEKSETGEKSEMGEKRAGAARGEEPRTLFAVLSAAGVAVYDAEQPRAICAAKDVHDAPLTDVCWRCVATEGGALSLQIVASSADGGLSFLSLGAFRPFAERPLAPTPAAGAARPQRRKRRRIQPTLLADLPAEVTPGAPASGSAGSAGAAKARPRPKARARGAGAAARATPKAPRRSTPKERRSAKRAKEVTAERPRGAADETPTPRPRKRRIVPVLVAPLQSSAPKRRRRIAPTLIAPLSAAPRAPPPKTPRARTPASVTRRSVAKRRITPTLVAPLSSDAEAAQSTPRPGSRRRGA